MDPAAYVAAFKALGAGLAVIALAGVGIGIGNIFSSMVSPWPATRAPVMRCFPSASWASR